MSKTFIVNGFKEVKTLENLSTLEKKFVFIGEDSMQVSDTFHTMEELYEHRVTLFIALCKNREQLYGFEKTIDPEIWRSKLHSDETFFDGWFILGIGKKKGEQITYHLPLDRWDEAYFAETLEKAPEWDGHKPADVLERLKNLSVK